MGFYDVHIEKLKRGETVQFRPSGNSMTPRIKHRELVTIAPVRSADVMVGDAVLCKVRGNIYVHLVQAVDRSRHDEMRFKIGNNHGHTNGWCGGQNVYGKVVKVDP
jgi:hypothetical protein